MYHKSVLKIGLLLLAVAAGPAQADPVEFTIEGELTGVLGVFSAPLASIAVGDAYTFRYVFESTTLDSDSNPALGLYEGAIQSFEVSIEAASVMGTPIIDFIAVDDESSAGQETYEAGVGTNTFIFSVFVDLATGTLTSDALPTTLDAGDFTTFQFTVFDPVNEGSAVGSLTAFTVGDGGMDSPEVPTVSEWGLIIMSLLLLAGGTILISCRRAMQA